MEWIDWDQASAVLFNDLKPWLELAKSWWHTIENGLVVLAFFLIIRRIKSERQKLAKVVTNLGEGLDEKIETAAQIAKAARDAAEAAITPQSSAPSGSMAHWEQLRSEWHDIRERIELAVKRIKHSRVRGKYKNFDRYSYRDIIVTLADDQEIPRSAEAALVAMNQRFMSLKSRPGQTTARDVSDFTEWKKAVNGSLPKLPKSKSGPNSPPPLPVPIAAE